MNVLQPPEMAGRRPSISAGGWGGRRYCLLRFWLCFLLHMLPLCSLFALIACNFVSNLGLPLHSRFALACNMGSKHVLPLRGRLALARNIVSARGWGSSPAFCGLRLAQGRFSVYLLSVCSLRSVIRRCGDFARFARYRAWRFAPRGAHRSSV